MKNKCSLLKIRWLFPALSSIVLLSCLASYISAGMYRSVNLTLLTGLIVLLFLLLNMMVWQVTSDIYSRLLQGKDFDLKKNELRNAILLSEQLAEYEENIYKVHHDLKNHLGVLGSMLEEEQQKEALVYTEKLRQRLENEGDSC